MLYVGIDARDCSKTMPKVNFPSRFIQTNVVDVLPRNGVVEGGWDLIVCYEVLEHMTKEAGQAFLQNIYDIMDDESTLLLSTPCYNGTMAENHIFEWSYEELKTELENDFIIDEHFGTFASIKDYASLMTPEEIKLINRLKKYYNSALVSCIMAPLYPEKSRNVLWRLRKKK